MSGNGLKRAENRAASVRLPVNSPSFFMFQACFTPEKHHLRLKPDRLLGYEHALLPRLSVRGAVSGIGYQADSSLTFLGFDIGAGVRYYPLGSAVAKFYLGGELAYSPISISYLDSEANSNIFSAALMAGWKIVFSNRFFMEPYIGYRAAMGELKLPSSIRSVSYNASGFMWGIGIGRTF